MIYLIMGVVFMLAILVCPIILIALHQKNNKKIKTVENEYNQRLELANSALEELRNEYELMFDDIKYKELSYSDVNTIVDDIIDEIWNQKYQMNYILRGVDVIPNMTTDISEMSKEVIESINMNLWTNIDRYYDRAYFGAKIVRRVELLFVDYTNRHKPPIK